MQSADRVLEDLQIANQSKKILKLAKQKIRYAFSPVVSRQVSKERTTLDKPRLFNLAPKSAEINTLDHIRNAGRLSDPKHQGIIREFHEI